MKKIFAILSFLTCLTLLSACNGSSGKNDSINGQPQTATTITINTITSTGVSQQSFDKNDTITLQATILDELNTPISGTRVNFSIDLGNLSVESALTNSDGIAIVNITNPEQNLSAGTASAQAGNLNQSIDYEYIDNSSIEALPTISMQLLLNGVVTNRFKADEQVQVVSTLLDSSGNAITNEIININADIGKLSATTALTASNGIASVTLFGSDFIPSQVIGAGVVTIALADNSAINTQINYEIVPADAVIDENIRLGYFDEDDSFIEGKIKLSITNNAISAGGTLGLSVDLIDSENNRVNNPTTIVFNSNCVSNGKAIVDTSVLSIKGRASATFEDINCAGVSGTEDIIIASVTTNGVTNTASETISITGEQLGSIEFVSAIPTSIVLTGSGGQETSILTFVVKSALGNVVAQQEVKFSLDTSVGGISLGRISGLTNSQGLISTQVSSGTTPTVARVTATASMEINGETITVQTQSNELSINTGLPEQASITIAASIVNPEASLLGSESTITAWLADSFNNPVPDGTSVNFTTEGGTIESSCNTINGNCSVTWTATEPLPTDHRSTILITASGHETFFDTNGNNIFDDSDGVAIVNANVSSGLNRQIPLASGFVDMSEAWRDDNENNTKESDETKFFDDNGDGIFSAPDGKFNGPQCTGTLCDDNAKKITLRKAMVLIMSSANSPNFVLSNPAETTIYQDNSGNTANLPDIADGTSLFLRFKFADSAMQTLPIGSQVSIELNGVTLTPSFDIGNSSTAGFRIMNFSIDNAVGGDPEEAILTISIKTPNTLKTNYITRTLNLL